MPGEDDEQDSDAEWKDIRARAATRQAIKAGGRGGGRDEGGLARRAAAQSGASVLLWAGHLMLPVLCTHVHMYTSEQVLPPQLTASMLSFCIIMDHWRLFLGSGMCTLLAGFLRCRLFVRRTECVTVTQPP